MSRRQLSNEREGIAPCDMLVRCFAERKDGQWQAFSLEFGLAAQGDSLRDVKAKLESMIVDYVREALTVDRKHAPALLQRRAAIGIYVKFYAYRALNHFLRAGEWSIFKESLPLELKHA